MSCFERDPLASKVLRLNCLFMILPEAHRSGKVSDSCEELPIMMTELRQIHEDGSHSVLSYSRNIWHIKLILSREKGQATLVGLMTSDLHEAKEICRRVLENECSHVCTAQCAEWEVISAKSDL